LNGRKQQSSFMLKTSDPKTKPKKTIWSGVFGLLDKLQIKDTITRNFIFRPPKPSYDFAISPSPQKNSPTIFNFKPNKEIQVPQDSEFTMLPFKLYREKKDVLYTIPVLVVCNKHKTSDHIMIFSHGNACDIGTIYNSGITLSKILKMDVILYDYTGYGISPHKPSETNTYKDLEAVIAFAVGRLNYPLNKIILTGFSLGSGPTVEMATRFHSLPFIILFASLASCLSIVSKGKDKHPSKHDIFDNLGKMGKIWCDVLLVHGDEDEMITLAHSQELMRAYNESHSPIRNKALILEVGGGDHVNLLTQLDFEDSEYRKVFLNHFKEFLTENHTTSVYSKYRQTIIQQQEGQKKAAHKLSDDELDAEIMTRRKLSGSKSDDEEGGSEKETTEGSEWNSGLILKEGGLDDEIETSVASRLIKHEMEYLKDLYSKLSVNDLPERWRSDGLGKGNQFMLYRKAMF